ncbi:hypothetical protein [Streptomyces sp. NPDC048411]|uniref:hypothetical protein n=1 Tax=Streptomyces sp. NPDC048411 TaxID=3157206 RepID=UPI003452D049
MNLPLLGAEDIEALGPTGAVDAPEAAAALSEVGDLLIPMAERAFTAEDITGNLADLVTGRIPDEKTAPFKGPRIFKSVGMGWEDLAVAAAVHRNSAP